MQWSPEYAPLLAILPALAALLILQLRGGDPRSNTAARNSDQVRPIELTKRSRPGRLARWRAARGVRHGFGHWTLGYAGALRPVSLSLDDLWHHTLVCGATGSGKTSALQLLVDALAEQLPVIVVDCKASKTLAGQVASIPNAYIWTIGGSLRWDPLGGDPTSVANRLLQGEWYSREADVYRAIAERYALWVLQALDMAGVERTPEMVLRHLEPQLLFKLLRGLSHVPEAQRLAAQVSRLGDTEREGIAGFRARFGLVLEGVAAKSLGPGLALEDAIRARRPVLFSLDAARYPELAAKLGAWILLDLVRVSALQPGPCLVIVDEFSALGREGRHVVPLLARTREASMACVVATQGLADLARVDPNLPQQITQNTTVRLVLRQGSAEDQQAWSRLLGGTPIAINDSPYVRYDRAWAVSSDELAMLRTGEAILQVAPRTRDGRRERLWVARPLASGELFLSLPVLNSQMAPSSDSSRPTVLGTVIDPALDFGGAEDVTLGEIGIDNTAVDLDETEATVTVVPRHQPPAAAKARPVVRSAATRAGNREKTATTMSRGARPPKQRAGTHVAAPDSKGDET